MPLPSGTKTNDPLGPGGTAAFAQNLLNQTALPRKDLMSQITDLLQSGGVGARVPIIQRAVEAETAAAGQDATVNRQNTARAGLIGSAFDVSNQLQHQTSSSSAIAGIGPNMAAQIFSQVPSIISNQTAQGLQAVSMETQRRAQNAMMQAQMLNAIRSSITGWYGGGSGGQASNDITTNSASIPTDSGGTSEVSYSPSGEQPVYQPAPGSADTSGFVDYGAS
jgi:hypothetical protein